MCPQLFWLQGIFLGVEGRNKTHYQPGLDKAPMVMTLTSHINVTNKIERYLEEVKRHLFLNTETANFVMINKIKINIPSNLFFKILISSNLSMLKQLIQ